MIFVFFVMWVVTGLLVGLIVSKFVNLRGDDPKGGILVAAAGAVVLGLIVKIASPTVMSDWSTGSCVAGVVGGLTAVIIWHLIRSRYVSHERTAMRRSY